MLVPISKGPAKSDIFSIQLLGSFFRIENMINSLTCLRPRCPPPPPASPQGRGIRPATPSLRPARDRSVSPAVVSAPPRSNLARALAPSARSDGFRFGSWRKLDPFLGRGCRGEGFERRKWRRFFWPFYWLQICCTRGIFFLSFRSCSWYSMLPRFSFQQCSRPKRIATIGFAFQKLDC